MGSMSNGTDPDGSGGGSAAGGGGGGGGGATGDGDGQAASASGRFQPDSLRDILDTAIQSEFEPVEVPGQMLMKSFFNCIFFFQPFALAMDFNFRSMHNCAMFK